MTPSPILPGYLQLPARRVASLLGGSLGGLFTASVTLSPVAGVAAAAVVGFGVWKGLASLARRRAS